MANKRLDPFLADCEPLLSGGAIDLALNREDRVDAAHRFDGEWRLAQISQLKEFAPGVAPAGRLSDRAGSAPGIIKIAEPGIGIGLQDPGIAGEMLAGVPSAAVAGVKEHRRWRVWTSERPVIPDISPQSPNDGFVLGQDRHGGVVAMQALGGEHVTAEQFGERSQVRRAGADPVGQGRYAELNAFAGKRFALPVERLVLAKLGVKDHRQQAGPSPAAGDDVKRCRRLSDLLTGPAGELLAHGLDHLPLPRHDLEGLGNVLAEFNKPAAAARTARRRRHHDALAWQVRWQRRPHRLAAAGAAHCRRLRRARAGGELVFRGARFQFLELQFQLIEQLAAALGRLPKPLAFHFGDQQFEMGDHRLGPGRARLRLLARGALGQQCAL